MARDTLTLQSIGALGAQQTADLAGTAVVSANDIDFANNGKVIILIKNAGAAPQDMVTVSVADRYGRTGDITVSPTNAKMRIAGPFPMEEWNQSDGTVHLDFGTQDNLTVYGIQLPDWF